MPFNEFERRADPILKTGELETRLLIRDMLFAIRRLNNKLRTIRSLCEEEPERDAT